MQFRDFISSAAIAGDLASTSKAEAIAEMVDHLISIRAISKDIRQSVLAALLDRESLGSTGIGNSIAIPHAKHPGVKKLTALFARSREGVEFDSLDGEPAHLFFLLLSNQETATQHLEALAYVSKQLKEEMFRSFLINARDEKEIAELFADADSKDTGGGDSSFG